MESTTDTYTRAYQVFSQHSVNPEHLPGAQARCSRWRYSSNRVLTARRRLLFTFTFTPMNW